MRTPRREALLAGLLFLSVLNVDGAEYFVAPYAAPGGDGSAKNPWSLVDALGHPSAVHAGDTIWLRGGTYSGIFNSYLTGTSTSPIIVRQYPGERATLDGGTTYTATILTTYGAYTWFWGFEITSSSTDRASTQTGSYPSDLNRPFTCFQNAQMAGSGVGIKLINMVMHNCGVGVGLWIDATNAEVYGNLIYYNGWNAPDRNHGHGIYSQNNAPSTRIIRDNIFYANFDYNVQVYSESPGLDNHVIDGNIVFWDGAAANPPGRGASINMGGGSSANNNSLTNNAFYGFKGYGSLDFSRGNQNMTMKDNLTGSSGVSGGEIDLTNQTGAVTVTGNRFAGDLFLPANYAALYPFNWWYLMPEAPPTGPWVLVRPNKYEAGRGHVAIFNWSHAASVPVDLSSILAVGSSFEVHNAQNYFGTPILSGTYAGGVALIPMAASSVEIPTGATAPSSTGPEFNAFVIVTKSKNNRAVVPAPGAPPANRRVINPQRAWAVNGFVPYPPVPDSPRFPASVVPR